MSYDDYKIGDRIYLGSYFLTKKDIMDSFKLNKFSRKDNYEGPSMCDGKTSERITKELEKALQ